ncbi:sulfite exporter TauE/SafE family protein [Pelosinus sp. UFO1]|uniref:urease accessory protein UreH domain-containing protein n=1 Tax=Pelosinus sp. UFO1 TaxID=484770 RepID=UPI0004D15AE8|nr:sulfite exporter TauE/SafE family protein [Pelosinus sp. UFO1]AIF53330.1 Heavy metal transport/detoxification protein [Pelosinus sp. UFO1]
MSTIAKKIPIQDMHCSSCEGRIEKVIRNVQGVKKVRASYAENMVYIEYDSVTCNPEEISKTIRNIGYTIGYRTQSAGKFKSVAGILIVFLAVLLLGNYTGNFDMGSKLKGEVTYLVLFMIGIFTSLHCVGMCGGIMLSQSIGNEAKGKFKSFLPSLHYNMGRVLGYTVLGGIVGAIGSVLSVSIGFMSGVAIFAGIFMIVMGLNMAGFSIFRKYLKISLPTHSLSKKVKAPFLVGLLNGLMPCGPLQTMQLYALGTGSVLQGASSMLVFALGTLPLMLSFGTLTSLFSKDSTKRIMKLSGVLVIVLGVIMTNRGLAIAGLNLPFSDLTAKGTNGTSMVTKAQIDNGVQTIRMSANNRGYTPNVLYVQKGVPVKWIVDGEQITSCNNQIIIPTLNSKKKLSYGENIIEFTPQDQDISFSCWMGMIRGVIKVVDDVSAIDVTKDKTSVASSVGGCCSTGGTQVESIYGDDIAKVSTERLIRKATISNKLQTVSIKGIGYEFEPLVVVIQKQTLAKIKIDLAEFDNAVGNWNIVDYKQKKVVSSFAGKQEIKEIDFRQDEVGTFGIYKDRKIIGVIEVVDNLATTDLENVRSKFL